MKEYFCRDCQEDWVDGMPYCSHCGSPWKNEVTTDEDPQEIE